MHDPMSWWLDLVRLITPARWRDLQGAARLALEQRLAAELVLQSLEDRQRLDLAPFPQPARMSAHPLNDRLRANREDLDEVLMSYDLSPHPSVVLLLEGATEMEIAPRVIELLSIPRHESHIRLVDMGGENVVHTLLAKYAALPHLGTVEHGTALFIRPPARYFVAVDGDRTYATAEARTGLRHMIAKQLAASLPTEFRGSDSTREIESLVVVECWADGLSFERAHFTDRELARGLLATGLAPTGTIIEDLVGDIADAWKLRAGIDRVWQGWPKKPTKPELAKVLWPTLRARINRKRTGHGLDMIPIVRVLRLAHPLAVQTPRRNVVFRIGQPDE